MALYLCTRNPMEVWVSGRNQHTANVPSCKAPKVRILLLPQIGGLAELVYCTGLENQRAVKRPKGSNPLVSSFLLRCSPAATRADCKSAAIRLRGFESLHLNDGSIVQLVEYRSPKPKVGGSNPSASAKSRDRVVAQLTSLISWAGQKPDAGSNPAPATTWSL